MIPNSRPLVVLAVVLGLGGLVGCTGGGEAESRSSTSSRSTTSTPSASTPDPGATKLARLLSDRATFRALRIGSASDGRQLLQDLLAALGINGGDATCVVDGVMEDVGRGAVTLGETREFVDGRMRSCGVEQDAIGFDSSDAARRAAAVRARSEVIDLAGPVLGLDAEEVACLRQKVESTPVDDSAGSVVLPAASAADAVATCVDPDRRPVLLRRLDGS